MRISKAFWIWGLFPTERRNLLEEIKFKVQCKLKSPIFDTHLTLAGPYLKINNYFLERLKNLADNNQIINLEVNDYEFREEIFKSFYISINNTKDLKVLRKNIYNLNKFELKNYSPHISLAYGNHELNDKKNLITKLPKFNKTLKMSQIALVDVDENKNLWKILKIYTLSSSNFKKV